MRKPAGPLMTNRLLLPFSSGLPRWLRGKELACQCRRREFDPWVGKIRWRRKWQPTPVFLPGKSHGQRHLAGHGITKSRTRLSKWTTETILLVSLFSLWILFVHLFSESFPSETPYVLLALTSFFFFFSYMILHMFSTKLFLDYDHLSLLPWICMLTVPRWHPQATPFPNFSDTRMLGAPVWMIHKSPAQHFGNSFD